MMRQNAGSKNVLAVAATALVLATVMFVGLVVVATGLLDSAPEELAIADTVEAISAESAVVTEGYFAGPEAVASVVAKSLERDADPASHVDLLRDLMASQPNLAGTFIGYPDGSFLDVRQDGEGQLRIKTIEITNGTRTVSTEVTDLNGVGIDIIASPSDTYDPTQRPWYEGASDGEKHWTDPYTFFTSQEPGITHSVPVVDAVGSTIAVVGVDIRLTALDSFLEARRPSENGGAAVMTTSGDLVAGRTQFLDLANSQSALDSWISGGASDSGVQRFGRDEPLIVSLTPISSGGNLLLVVDAPESDFLNDLRNSRRDVGVLASILGVIGLALLLLGAVAVKRYVEVLDRLTATDTLTGRLNRTGLYAGVEEVAEESARVTIMTIDLDGFKLINDQFGHHAGDQTLTQVGERLAKAAPRNALVARLGGDEFCVALLDPKDPASTCEQILSSASGAIDIDGYSFGLNLSAGHASAGGPNIDTSRLLQRADVAMYIAKALPGTTAIEFDDSMSLRWDADIERKELLTEAIELGQMDVFFQPELNLHDGSVLGAEALLRWNHPTNGLTTARDFIDDLERFDLLRGLLPVLFEKSEQLATSFVGPDPFTIRLNISAKQLLSLDLMTQLERVTNSDIARWGIEINEETMASASPIAIETLNKLRQIGVEVVIDDYGMGRSSLSDLTGGPFDALKVAPKFVNALGSGGSEADFATLLAEHGAVLGVEMLASGIQTETELEALITAGYQRGQGFIFSEPLNAKDFVDRWQPMEQAQAA